MRAYAHVCVLFVHHVCVCMQIYKYVVDILQVYEFKLVKVPFAY